MEKMISLLGLFCLVGSAYLMSSKRSEINWRTVISGIALQVFLGVIILKTDLGLSFFVFAKKAATGLLNYTDVGSVFLFGSLAQSSKVGFVFFTMVLPTIIFVSSLMSILYYLGVMQKIIRIIAWAMVRLMGISGSEAMAAAANIFVGQTEAPLVIKPYVPSMTRSELMSLMTGGMSTVAGGVLAAFVGLGIDAGHLLAASVMSAPAAIVCAKLMIPELSTPQNIESIKFSETRSSANLIDAAATGAAEGLKLAMNVGAMLLAFVALVAMINSFLGHLGGLFSLPNLSLELITGYLFAPVAWVIGIPWADAVSVGGLLGKKIILNEFVAYLELQKLIQGGEIGGRAITIATYALCGFANFSSIAIQLGGIGTIAPTRKAELASLGIRALVAGTLACLMTATIAGLIL